MGRTSIDRIVDVIDARDHPNQVQVHKMLTHEC
jgi:hypothetical protein